MHQRERHYIPAYGADDKAVSEIINKAIQRSRDLPNIKRIVFLTNVLNNTQWLEKQFGYDGPKKLKAGVKLEGTNAIGKFESLKTYNSNPNDIVITFTLGSDDILLVEDSFDISAIFVIPWTNDAIEKWTRITNAINIKDNNPAASYANPPCLVSKALEDLTETINMATGLGNPNDNDQAKTYLRALSGKGYRLDPLEIESYLIKQLNWAKEFSDELLEIVNKINAGKPFQGGDKIGHKYHIDRWKKECEE